MFLKFWVRQINDGDIWGENLHTLTVSRQVACDALSASNGVLRYTAQNLLVKFLEF